MDKERDIHPDYQKYMDWVYWLKAYSQRTEGSIFSSFDEKTSDQIMDEVLSGKPLHVDFALNATPRNGAMLVLFEACPQGRVVAGGGILRRQ